MQTAKTVLIDLARRQIGMLRAELKHQASHQKANPTDLEAAHQKLLRTIANSRLSLLQLSTCLEKTGDDPESCPEVKSLIEVLDEAALLLSQLYALLYPNYKKRSLKAFEESILSMIQEGKGPTYFKTVTKKDIINQGDELNRLYQLLVESKTAANVFRVDAVTLRNAAARADLFSSTQCANLLRWSKEAEVLMLKETERLVTEFVRKEEYDKLQREFQELSAEHDDQAATGAVSSATVGWTCGACTFQNEESSTIHCRACRLPRSPELDFVTIAKRKPANMKDALNYEALKKSGMSRKLDPAKKTVWVRMNDVPELIGPGGRNVEALKDQTGAKNIYAYQEHADSDGRCPVQVLGPPSAVRATVTIIEQKFPLHRQVPKKSHTPAAELDTPEERYIYIDNSEVPALIGQNGKSIQALIEATGVKTIYAHQNRLDVYNRCPIEIAGPSKAIQKAVTMIEQRCSKRSLDKEVVWIPNADVPEFIGPGGRNAKFLKKQTGIDYVTADQKYVRDGMCPILIEGSAPTMKEAVAIVLSEFDGTLDGPWNATEEVGLVNAQKAPPVSAAGKEIQNETPSKPQVPVAIPSQVNDNKKESSLVKPPPPPVEPLFIASLPKMDPRNSRTIARSDAVGSGDGVPADTANTVDMKPLALPCHSTTKAIKTETETETEKLLSFLREHKNSFKCTAETFHEWLQSEGIENLSDFLEALADDEFVKEEMQQNGFKGFKRRPLVRAIESKMNSSCDDSFAQESSSICTSIHPGVATQPPAAVEEPPSELICPIRHVLFQDPVVACDGHCYEREAIEDWFRKTQSEGVPLLSPLTSAPLEDLTLMPNITIRNMAREFKRNHPSAS